MEALTNESCLLIQHKEITLSLEHSSLGQTVQSSSWGLLMYIPLMILSYPHLNETDSVSVEPYLQDSWFSSARVAVVV